MANAPADDKAANPAPDASGDVPAEPVVKGKILSDEEHTNWGNELTIDEKPAKTEENVLKTEFEEAANDGTQEESQEKPEENPDKTDETDEDIGTTDLPEPATTVIPDNPGEFKAPDLSFEVTTYDEEGNKPKTVKVNSIEQWEQILGDDPNLGNSLAVNKAFRAAQKMESGLEAAEKDYNTKVEEFNSAVEQNEIVTQRYQSIFNEMQYLTDRGDLPKLTKEETDNLDWEDPKVLTDHPNIAPHKELLNYMRQENGRRTKNGVSPLSSVVDAYNAMQLDTRVKTDQVAKTKAADARKEAGARVASGSANPVTAAPKGIAVGRVGDLSRLGQNWSV